MQTVTSYSELQLKVNFGKWGSARLGSSSSFCSVDRNELKAYAIYCFKTIVIYFCHWRTQVSDDRAAISHAWGDVSLPFPSLEIPLFLLPQLTIHHPLVPSIALVNNRWLFCKVYTGECTLQALLCIQPIPLHPQTNI